MAQVTGAIDRANFQIQTSTDGTTWAHHASAATSVTHTGEEQMTGSQNTADGSAPIVVGSDKHSPAVVEVRGVYVKTASGLWDAVRDRWEGSSKTIYFRWAPEGGIGTVVGNDQFLCADDAGSAFACPIQVINSPELDASSGDPALFMFRLTCPKVVRGATST